MVVTVTQLSLPANQTNSEVLKSVSVFDSGTRLIPDDGTSDITDDMRTESTILRLLVRGDMVAFTFLRRFIL